MLSTSIEEDFFNLDQRFGQSTLSGRDIDSSVSNLPPVCGVTLRFVPLSVKQRPLGRKYAVIGELLKAAMYKHAVRGNVEFGENFIACSSPGLTVGDRNELRGMITAKGAFLTGGVQWGEIERDVRHLRA